ncbi:MAG TPA: hypothetical protein DCS20_02500 [Candidatus Yonathbacteria bacterium]|nr:hypothetical protein [Candidatus Yonathbacteria bacterium]
MCFSATASFVAGAALSATGVTTLKKAKKKRDVPFAAIPLLFGVQQGIEGLVWLSFGYGASFFNQVASYAFMLVAYVFWPSFVPFAIRSLETDPNRKQILAVFQGLGVGVSLYLLYFIMSNPVISHIVNKSIVYPMPTEHGALIMGLYLLATCVSCFFSSNKIINIFGTLIAVSFGTAYYFYTTSFVSVWCFFGAILSIAVYWYFKNAK